MKLTLGIIAFILTFGLSVSIVGLLFGLPAANSSQFYQLQTKNTVAKYKIRSIIRRDVRNGYWRNHQIRKIEGFYTMSDAEIYSHDTYRRAIDEYVRKSSAINDADLPEDFKYAWREHMRAWQNQSKYLQTSVAGDQYSAYSDNTEEINQTWYQVLRIAERYGVEIIPAYFN